MKNGKIEFSEEEWSCMRLIYNCPASVRYMAPYIARELNNRYSIKKIRRIIAILTDKGCLNRADDRLTRKGAAAYLKYGNAWLAICAKQYELGLQRADAQRAADYLISVYPTEVLRSIEREFMDTAALGAGDAMAELITDTDFCGRLPIGIYKVAYDILCTGDDNGRLMESLLPAADLIIEPMGSRLELKWIDTATPLEGAVCEGFGDEIFIEEKAQILRLPTRLMSFEYVSSYKILQGSLRLCIVTRKWRREARLELPLLSD